MTKGFWCKIRFDLRRDKSFLELPLHKSATQEKLNQSFCSRVNKINNSLNALRIRAAWPLQENSFPVQC